jgi:dTDP-glucose 4,6-dehydratase
MSKRCLLTGAGGFFGSHLLRHLLINTDWEIVCVCSWRHKGIPERVKNALAGDEDFRNRVTIITHDLTAPFTERTKKSLGKIDYILNIASNSHVNRSITNPEEFIVGNTALAFNMLELARELKPTLFLQFSTDETFGPAPEGVNFHEWSPVIPSNPYSASKACQEAIAISYWRTYRVPVVITNTMNLVGQTQDPEKYPSQLIRKIHNGEEVTIHGKEGDIGSRFYIHARNAADAVLYIITNLPPVLYKEDEVLVPDRYNIVGEVELNNLELAELTAKMMGKTLTYKLEPCPTERPGHDKRYALSGKKLADKGWKPPEDFETSWRNTITWTLNNPSWL